MIRTRTPHRRGVDQAGRQLGQTTGAARTLGPAELLGWARRCWPEERRWAVRTAATAPGGWNATCWPPGAGGAGPPRLLAGAARPCVPWQVRPDRRAGVARAALGEPDCRPPATTSLLGVKLLVDQREHLVAERTRTINRLRWHLHRLDPDLEHAVRRLPGLPGPGRPLAGRRPSSVQVTSARR